MSLINKFSNWFCRDDADVKPTPNSFYLPTVELEPVLEYPMITKDALKDLVLGVPTYFTGKNKEHITAVRYNDTHAIMQVELNCIKKIHNVGIHTCAESRLFNDNYITISITDLFNLVGHKR